VRLHGLGNGGGQRGVVAGVEEIGPGGHHRRVVRGARRSGADEEADVSLLGHVERVPARASHRLLLQPHAGAAYGADQIFDDVSQHVPHSGP
jgi:hypothetical protein